MKRYFHYFLSLCVAASLGACSHEKHDHDHDHHGEETHSHEEHDHESEDHDHEHSHEHGEENHAHDGAVVMEPEKAASFGIETTILQPSTFAEIIPVSGQIEPAPSDRMTVTAKRSGIVTLNPGISPGTKVSSGSGICSISSKGMQGGDVNSAAAANLEKTKKEIDRLTPLYKEGIVTASEFNEAERAYKEALALSGAAVSGAKGVSSETAPGAGIVTDIFVTSGQYVEAGAPIASIAKNSRLTLRADVPEKYLPRISSIVSANFRPDYTREVFSVSELGGKRISGDATAASRNGYIPVYFSFDSNGNTLAGAYTEVYLKGAQRDNVISVPREALIEMQGNKYIYVREHGHAYEKRLVKTGATDGLNVEIVDGLMPGEEIVTKGATIVRMAETSAIAPPGHTHNH